MIPTDIAPTLRKTVASSWLEREYPIYPTLGLFATIVGTCAAISMLPADTTTPDALFPSAVVMTLGLAIAPAAATWRSPRTLLRAEHILVLCPIYWLLLDLLQQAYTLESLHTTSIAKAFLGIGLFAVGVWLTVFLHPPDLPRPVAQAANHTLNPRTIFKLILVFFALGILKFAYFCNFNPVVMFAHLGSDRWSAPWSREAIGGWSSFIDHLDYFGYLLPTLTALLAVRSRRLTIPVILAVFFSTVMTAFLAQSGGRRIIGVVLGAAIVCWVLEQHKVKLKQIVISVVSVALILGFMQWMLEARNTGFQEALQEQEFKYSYLHVDDNFLRLSPNYGFGSRL